jgi:putative ABC transport system permease protein
MTWHDLVRKRARDTGIDLPSHAVDELAAHLEDLYAAARAAGLDHDAASARALGALHESSLAAIRSRTRRPETRLLSFRGIAMIPALRLALRQFRQHPTFALVTVLVLGLGTGASVAVFTVLDTVLLRPLPYRDADRLVTIWETNVEQGLMREPLSPVNFMDYAALDTFEGAAAWWRPDVNLIEPGSDPVRVRTIETSANLFDVLGVSPQVGPGFPKDGPLFSRAELIAVISDRLWRERYSANRDLIGKQITLNGRQYTVVGVMPPRFDFPGNIDVRQRSAWDFRQHSRAAHFMEAVARRTAKADVGQAGAALATLTRRFEADFPQTNKAWSARVVPLLDDQLGYYRPALIVLFGAVGLLAVIGCLNVASLVLTRALGREREVAVRTALGASPRHLIAQLLAEALVISVAGAVVGTVAAVLVLPAIVAATPVEIPRLSEAALSWRVLGFATALAMGATMLFGVVPALVLIRRNMTTGLKSGERGTSRASRVLYRTLVAGEVALACALLISSGLLVRTVGRMMDVPIGVSKPGVVTASLQISGPTNATLAEWAALGTTYGSILDHARQQPGIRTIGISNFLPLTPGWRSPFTIEGRPPIRVEEQPQAQYATVSEGYFEAIGAMLTAGRFFTATDDATRPGVIIVNESLAKRAFPGESAVGHRLESYVRQIGPLGRNLVAPVVPPAAAGAPPVHVPPGVYEIVGVVADVKNVALAQPTEPAVYFPARQFPFRAMFVAVEAEMPAAVAALKSSLQQFAPNVPIYDVRTWADRARSRTAEPRLLMTVLVFFGALAAGLAALGVYGLFSWTVALRRRELAIRLTLGAKPARIGGLVVRQGFVLAIAGLAAGWAIIVLAGRALERVLFNVTPHDPASTATAAAILLGASLVACIPAAVRAMRVDPIEGLRAE